MNIFLHCQNISNLRQQKEQATQIEITVIINVNTRCDSAKK